MRIEGPEADSLRRECNQFCRLLTTGDASSYVTDKYVAAHSASASLRETRLDAVERMLLEAARGSEFSLRCADMYARFFRPNGMLRRKLVLLLAIAENAPVAHVRLNTAHAQTPARAWLHLAALLIVGAGILLIALLRFAPRHMLAARASVTLPDAVVPAVPRVSSHTTGPRFSQSVHNGEVER